MIEKRKERTQETEWQRFQREFLSNDPDVYLGSTMLWDVVAGKYSCQHLKRIADAERRVK